MKSGTVFFKTEKGEAEIRKREHGLDVTCRRALIFVDGKQDVGTILRGAKGIDGIDEALAWLEKEAFIEHRETLKDQLVRLAEETLGDKAQKIVNKIREAPDTAEGLRAAAEGCKKLVKLTISEQKAEELIRKCEAILAVG